jgi:hypothetical protein
MSERGIREYPTLSTPERIGGIRNDEIPRFSERETYNYALVVALRKQFDILDAANEQLGNIPDYLQNWAFTFKWYGTVHSLDLIMLDDVVNKHSLPGFVCLPILELTQNNSRLGSFEFIAYPKEINSLIEAEIKLAQEHYGKERSIHYWFTDPDLMLQRYALINLKGLTEDQLEFLNQHQRDERQKLSTFDLMSLQYEARVHLEALKQKRIIK